MKHLFKRIMCAAGLLAAEFSLSSVQAAAGDLYDGGLNSHAIYKFTPAGVKTTFASPIDADWVAFDSKGNLFASVSTKIAKIAPNGSINPSFATATGFIPTGLAFDAAGNLYAGDAGGGGRVVKISTSGTITPFASPVPGPAGLAFDRAGNLYVSKQGNNTIVKIASNGMISPFVSSGLNFPQGLAFDSAGNLYEADLNSGKVLKFTSTGSPLGPFASSLNSPRSLAFDRDGNLFVGEFGGNSITKVTANGTKITPPFATNTFIGGLAFEPPTAQLTNISTRASVQTGSGVTIGGFIITGTASKPVVVRGLGPTLTQFNVTGVLADPFLSLVDGSGNVIWNNDNWKDSQQAAIQATGLAPPNDLESAILQILQPGNYTAILSGKNGTTGVGLVEVYDISTGTFAELTNVSTRGFVGTGQGVMIGGIITSGGNGSTQIVVRGLGPTLTQLGVAGALADPVVTLVDNNGNVVRTNDNWKNTQQAAIQATGLAPPNDLEAAILVTVATGHYTAILSGNGGGTGIGLVEVYKLR